MPKVEQPKDEPSNAQVMTRLADLMERQEANAPRREITLGDPEYQERLRKEGFFTKLEKPAFQNGREVQARGLPEKTIHRLARLKTGSYIGGKVRVMVDAKEQVHLSYKSATPEDRMRFALDVAPTFEVLVDKVWAEMPA